MEGAMERQWKRVNQFSTSADDEFKPSEFILKAISKTDIYASPLPPTLHVFTAPITHTRVELSNFSSARVSFAFVPTLQFDQGGLIFTVPSINNPDPDAGNSQVSSSHPAWVKAGVEVNDGQPWISVVSKARNGWCDWSLVPMPTGNRLGNTVEATIEMVRYRNALMIYYVNKESRTLIRKIPWVFLPDPELAQNAWIGAYTARPDPDSEAAENPLEMHFKGLCVR
ncbi:hypothetical protein BX600DRAFT_284874 [Xylariales sp. PMI_506]|nr:hypothetical protein BX600DRAFT_284874 [Xylariales sp. PMI_506]